MKEFEDVFKITSLIIVSSFILGLYYVHSTGSKVIFSVRLGSSSAFKNDSKSFDNFNNGSTPIQCEREENTTIKSQKSSLLHLAMVVCGDRITESLVSLKSVAIFTKSNVHAHIYADEPSTSTLQEHLSKWPVEVRKRFNYTLNKIQYPPGLNYEGWKQIFRPCSTQRLFLPLLMKDVDSLVYLDTDTLLLTSLENVWKHFYSFNSTQISGLAPEAEEGATCWYKIISGVPPYVPPYGVNSGVMLMNLTRMRNIHWTNLTLNYYKRHGFAITLGDQDLINIFFHFNPEKLFQFPCSWNFRSDHCQYASGTSKCQSALTDGASVLHGSRSTFTSDKQPAIRAVYSTFTQHMLNQSVENELLPRLKKNLHKSSDSLCKEVSHVFTRQIEKKLYCDQQRILKENPRTIIKPLGL